MSGQIAGEVFQYAPVDLRMLDRFVLVSLAESANNTTRVAKYNSSAEKIADRIQSTPSSVRNALGRLRQRGLIVPQIARVKPGQAQQWYIPKLTEDHRRATWEHATGELHELPVDKPRTRNPGVALRVVDNP